MNIQELGSIGEFVAAIATIITLIYLALQIRQNTNLLKLSEIRGVQDDADRWRTLLIQNKEVASIYRCGLTEPDILDADDRLRFRMLQDQLFFAWQVSYVQHPEAPAIADGVIKNTLGQPGGKLYWEKSRHRFQPMFVEYVDTFASDA